METCIFCDGNIEKNIIKKFEYWNVYLYPNQCYLGRVYIALNKHGPESILELDDREWHEFKIVIDKVAKALKTLYNYDLMNYIILQNKDRNHFHMQLIPRYIDARILHGEEFKDELWGKSPIPTPQKEFSEKILMKIKDDIKKEL